MAVTYLLVALGLSGGGIMALWYRWRLEHAEADAELWRTTVKRQLDDLNRAAEMQRRQEAEADVLRSALEAQTDYLAALAAAHPELVGDYVRSQLQRAGALTAGLLPAVPGAAGAGAAPGGDR